MKISLRILIINFVIVALVLLSSTFVFYSLTNKMIVLQKLPEAAELRSNINIVLWVIGLAGVALSLILVMLFTEKIRKQITRLSNVAEQTRSGNLSHRVNIVSKDELGKLASAFDNMLDELEKNEISKNEYTEFISLINQNPTLSEISEASLAKIINSINFTVGRLSLVENNELKPLSNYGLADETLLSKKADIYQRVILNREILEFDFPENGPKISTGLVDIELKYILIYPVIYNHKVIAVLELAAIYKPKAGIKEYLGNIHDQLAIGLTNANTYGKLKDSVNELKYLNEQYQKQNEQISEQNKKLIELHKELKENAEELQIQKNKAEEGATLKSQFLASISHELKTPLNSIIGLTELMITDTVNSNVLKEKLQVVLRNGNRLMNLINDILSFSKMEAGKMELEKESFQICDLLNEIDVEIQPLAAEKSLNFIVHNEISIDIIFNSDKKKILQVLINLLSNAVKFTEKGMIILKCRYSDNSLNFEIIDSGIGISQENLKIIFEEFRQLDGALNRKYNGTGLGLAICKRYSQMLNGELLCQSEPGKGSTFTFIIPVEMHQQKKDMQLSLNLPSMRNIVLIEESSNKNIVSQYLVSKNFNVINSNSEQFLRDVSEFKPFAIACNYSSDKKGLWKLLLQLTRNENCRELPFILYTIIDEMNVGYGLPVFNCIAKNDYGFLQAAITKYERLTGKQTERVVYITETSENLKQNGIISINLNEIKITPRLFRKSDIILVDLVYEVANSLDIIYSLKESTITRELPIILLIPENLSETEISILNESFERCAVKSKGYPIDVLKILRDRLHLEDGMPYEDTSSIWVDNNPDVIIQQIADPVPNTEKDKNLVLIVDDDTDTLFTVGEIIKRTGCDTIFAKNGVECLSILKTMTPDLILLDIMMPKMDGFETIKRIKADEHFGMIPVYAMTAQAMIEEKEIIIKNGFSDFIPKPVNPASLSFKVKKALLNKTLEVPDEENIDN